MKQKDKSSLRASVNFDDVDEKENEKYLKAVAFHRAKLLVIVFQVLDLLRIKNRKIMHIDF